MPILLPNLPPSKYYTYMDVSVGVRVPIRILLPNLHPCKYYTLEWNAKGQEGERCSLQLAAVFEGGGGGGGKCVHALQELLFFF